MVGPQPSLSYLGGGTAAEDTGSVSDRYDRRRMDGSGRVSQTLYGRSQVGAVFYII